MKTLRNLYVPAVAGLALLSASCLSGNGSGSASGQLQMSESSPLPSAVEAEADAETAITAENADETFEALKAAIEADLAAMEDGN